MVRDFMPSFSKKTFFSRKLGDVGDDEGDGVDDDDVIEIEIEGEVGDELDDVGESAGAWSYCRKWDGFALVHFSPSGHAGLPSGTCVCGGACAVTRVRVRWCASCRAVSEAGVGQGAGEARTEGFSALRLRRREVRCVSGVCWNLRKWSASELVQPIPFLRFEAINISN